jgi:sugar phosphate isomerase/epimerase
MAHRPLSLHHLSMLDAGPEELVEVAIAAGFDHAGLRIVSPDTGAPVGDLVGDVAARRRLRSLAGRLPGGILDVEAVWLRAETDVAALASVLDAAVDLGARYVLTVGHDPDRRRLVDRFGALAELAAGAGIRLVIEPITYCAISDIKAARSLIDELGRDDVAVLVDALQFFRSGASLDELRGAPPSLFPYAQIADGPVRAPEGLDALRAEARSNRAVPGTGEFDLRGWVSALPPGIPLAVEVPSPVVRALPPEDAARMLRRAVEEVLDV